MKSYYIVSLKHTSKADSAFTLWRPDSKGYCWYENGQEFTMMIIYPFQMNGMYLSKKK